MCGGRGAPVVGCGCSFCRLLRPSMLALATMSTWTPSTLARVPVGLWLGLGDYIHDDVTEE